MDASTWLTAREAAEILGLDARTVRYRIAQGHLHAERRGNLWLIDPASIEAEAGRKPYERRTAS